MTVDPMQATPPLPGGGSRTAVAPQDAEAWARRLYARLPLTYRIEDLELARRRVPSGSDEDALLRAPLLGLLRTVARRVAELRADIDDLWDDFFLETCDDRVVPYLGALLGTTLLDNPVGQDNRLDVLHTVRWRQSKGTPAMLAEVSAATTGRPVEVVELLGTVAWVQHVDHVKPERTLTPRLDDPAPLADLGSPADPCAHLVDLRPAADLDLPRLARSRHPGAPPVEQAAWGTPGWHRLGALGVAARPLQAFRLTGVTPAPVGPRTYTFDPRPSDPRRAPGRLHSARRRTALRRVDAERRLADVFGAGDEHDLAVRRWGVLLATPVQPGSTRRPPDEDFAFGTPEPAVRLHETQGLRLLGLRPGPESQSVVLTVLWESGGELRRLGALSTALWPQPRAYVRDSPLGGAGRLRVRVEAARPDPALGWDDLPPASVGRLPAVVLAVRDDSPPRAAVGPGGRPAADGAFAGAVLVHLPELVVPPGAAVDLVVAADGSTHLAADGPGRGRAARLSEGPVWPPSGPAAPSPWPLTLPDGLHRVAGLRIADPSRLDPAAPVLVELFEVSGAAQPLGGVPTGDLPVDDRLRSDYGFPPDADIWPAGTFRPSLDAALDRLALGPEHVLALAVGPADPGDLTGPVVVPQLEVVVTDRAGRAVLAYLPELRLTPGEPVAELLLAEDGSTYRATGSVPDEPVPVPFDADLARAAAGQVLPVEGAVPLQRRVVVGGPPGPGELGLDVGSGRFCLGPDDPLLAAEPAQRGLTVDYVEAFPARLGARAYGRPAADDRPTRVVAASGDAAVDLPAWRIHPTVAAALAAAADGEVIEIVDSATYAEQLVVPLAAPGAAHGITLRAAGTARLARPCLLPAPGTGDDAVLQVRGPAAGEPTAGGHALTLAGLLVSGQQLAVTGHPAALERVSCTVDPPPGGRAAVRVADDDLDRRGRLTVRDSQLGAVHVGPGVADVVVSDSIVATGAGTGLALGGLAGSAVEPDADADVPAGRVELDRVTVLGRLRCDALSASETLLAGLAVVDDRQRGCVRYSRYEPGSLLPRRFRCVPGDDAAAADAAVAFRSLRVTSPEFGSLAPTAGAAVRTASEAGDVVGALAGTHPGLRIANLRRRLDEALPVGLQAVVGTRS